MSEEPSREALRAEVSYLRRHLDEFLDLLPDALVEVDLRSQRVTLLNRMAQILFGYDREAVAAGLDSRLLFGEGEFDRARDLVRSFAARSLSTGEAYQRTGRQELHEFQLHRRDGSVFTAEAQSSFVLDDAGQPVRMRSIVRDVTPRKELERQLAEMGLRDPLTGCYNRHYLERQRPELERPTARWACLLFDLKGFKAINDTYGHDEGDRVLRSGGHPGAARGRRVRARPPGQRRGRGAGDLQAPAGGGRPRQPGRLQHGPGLPAAIRERRAGAGPRRPRHVRVAGAPAPAAAAQVLRAAYRRGPNVSRKICTRRARAGAGNGRSMRSARPSIRPAASNRTRIPHRPSRGRDGKP